MTLQINDIPALAAACADYGIPEPKALADAKALHKAATELLAAVKAEVEPDPHAVTVKTLADHLAALVAWPSHDARETAAARLAQVGETAVVTAWLGFAVALMEALRGPFDDAAARFAEGDQGAAAQLAQLAHVRDILATVAKPDLGNGLLERETRVLVWPSMKLLIERHNRVQADVLTPAPGRYEAAWWSGLAALGVAAQWHTPADQVALAAATRAASKTSAA